MPEPVLIGLVEVPLVKDSEWELPFFDLELVVDDFTWENASELGLLTSSSLFLFSRAKLRGEKPEPDFFGGSENSEDSDGVHDAIVEGL